MEFAEEIARRYGLKVLENPLRHLFSFLQFRSPTSIRQGAWFVFLRWHAHIYAFPLPPPPLYIYIYLYN